MNYEYAKIDERGTGLIYDPDDYAGTLNASEATRNANGYFKIKHNAAPTAPEGQMVIGGHYIYADEDGKRVVKTDWHIVAKPVDRADYDAAMEAHLRAERDARGYTDREPTDYLQSGVQRWRQDALDWVAHRDEVMLYGLSVINRFIETGAAPTLAEFRDGLPKIKWTEA